MNVERRRHTVIISQRAPTEQPDKIAIGSGDHEQSILYDWQGILRIFDERLHSIMNHNKTSYIGESNMAVTYRSLIDFDRSCIRCTVKSCAKTTTLHLLWIYSRHKAVLSRLSGTGMSNLTLCCCILERL